MQDWCNEPSVMRRADSRPRNDVRVDGGGVRVTRGSNFAKFVTAWDTTPDGTYETHGTYGSVS